MDGGWRLKDLAPPNRHVGDVSPVVAGDAWEMAARDPDNRLLARVARACASTPRPSPRTWPSRPAGLLEPRVGGRSVYPPLPGFMVLPPVSYGPKGWPEDHGPERYERAIYSFRYRSLPYPVFQNFDAPNGDAACVRRARSNTPLQALTTLNEPLFVECAPSHALRMHARRRLDRRRSARASHSVAASADRRRRRNRAELLLLEFCSQSKSERISGTADAKPWDVAADDPAHPPELPASVTPIQAAAWTAVARVLLNLDETITKE